MPRLQDSLLHLWPFYLTKGPAIDEDRYDQLGTHCGEYEWRVGTLYPIRDDDGDIYEAVHGRRRLDR